MRSMRHVKKSQKCRASKNRNAAKHRAHKREVASKRVWLGKTQFWERRSPIDEKFFAEVVVGGSAQTAKSSKPAEETKAQLKAKAKVLNQAPSGSQVKEVVKAPKKNQKKTNEVVEVITKKTTKQTESAVANGVPAKVQDKKKDVGEQLRVEINEKQSLDNDDMKSSVDSGVDVAHEHVSTKTTTIAPVTAAVTASPAPSPASSLAKRPRQYKLLPRDIEFCAYMLETYGDNYEGMASDSKNVYRDTANGIARKLRIFRESPQYDEYLQSKSA